MAVAVDLSLQALLDGDDREAQEQISQARYLSDQGPAIAAARRGVPCAQ